MQSELIGELLKSVNTQLVTIVFQFVVLSFVVMSIKDFSMKCMNYIKVRMSDLGRGTKVEIAGKVGYIQHVGFNEVEIQINDTTIMLIPLDNFIKANKVIMRERLKR